MQTRQQQILNLIVKEHIKTAEPVGSLFLVENCNLNISPATVRNEMAELEESGYLVQPYTSAGRVPTDKGYRFFVDKIVSSVLEGAPDTKITDRLKNRIKRFKKQNSDKLSREVAKEISIFSRGVGVCGFADLYSSGLSNLFKEPEFVSFPEPAEILEVFDSLEARFEKIFKNIENDIEIFIGSENIDKELRDFSLVVSRCAVDDEEGVIGIMGPKRMNYAQNISLVSCVREFMGK